MLAVCSQRPHAFNSADLGLLSGLAEFISTAIGAATDLMEITARLCSRQPRELAPGEEAERTNKFVASVLDPRGLERMAACERIEKVLAERRYQMAFQPIFDLRDGTIFAVEALARFCDEPYRAPDVWLAERMPPGSVWSSRRPCCARRSPTSGSCPRRPCCSLNAGHHALVAGSPRRSAKAHGPERVIVVSSPTRSAVHEHPQLAGSVAGSARHPGHAWRSTMQAPASPA